jgi:hypothetical protein
MDVNFYLFRNVTDKRNSEQADDVALQRKNCECSSRDFGSRVGRVVRAAGLVHLSVHHQYFSRWNYYGYCDSISFA